MPHKLCGALLLVSIAAIGMAAGGMCRGFESKEDSSKASAPLRIHVSRISYKEVLLIGELGVPLGEPVDLRGRWDEDKVKSFGLVFYVDEVNGQRLENTAVFPLASVSAFYGKKKQVFKRGEVWALRAVETGGLQGFSRDVWTEAGQGQPDEPLGFITEIVYLRATRVD